MHCREQMVLQSPSVSDDAFEYKRRADEHSSILAVLNTAQVPALLHTCMDAVSDLTLVSVHLRGGMCAFDMPVTLRSSNVHVCVRCMSDFEDVVCTRAC